MCKYLLLKNIKRINNFVMCILSMNYVFILFLEIVKILHVNLNNYFCEKLRTKIMDFKDSINQISDRVKKLKDNLLTEEATKNALIMPFLTILGYDVFNPLEVVPEFTCDIGSKKGEKIDYAIMQDGKPVVLIECKHWQQDLNLHDNQLLRYFNVANAKFGILTNGIIYRFYTDLETSNKMDEKPFLEVNITELKEHHIEELKKFHKSYFDIDNILSSASELKYTNELKRLINDEFTNPSPDFVRLFTKQAYDGIITAKVLEQFTGLMKKSLQNYVNDKITERLKSAIEKQEKTEEQSNEAKADNAISAVEVITTQEEIEAFYIIRSILRPHIDCNRITYRDAQSYFSVIIDDNNRKPVCRLYFNSQSNKRITFIDENKKEIHNKITTIDDIYNYSEQLIKTIEKYKIS